MPRLMSVAMTEQAVVERRKTVTRRRGWRFLKPGDRLTLCRKVMGRRAGEPLVRLAEVEVVSVRREQLGDIIPVPGSPSTYGSAEVAREGFPGMHPYEFVRQFFIEAQGMSLVDPVTRIAWRYLDDREPGHEFLPVAGHPDDDECTHRADGTDATYCGRPRGEHHA